MASAKALNAKNLEALGAGRLAALLIEVAAGDAGIKRRLRLALAGEASPADAAREVALLIRSGRSTVSLDWPATGDGKAAGDRNRHEDAASSRSSWTTAAITAPPPR